jgi:N-acetylneuraminic acid mutarotase
MCHSQRSLVHHNKASETLLQIQDFGGIEGWGAGPAYFYNNISIKPGGLDRHNDWYHKNEAFYFDHQWKGYFFNNIGWTDPRPDAWTLHCRLRYFNQAGATATLFSTIPVIDSARCSIRWPTSR